MSTFHRSVYSILQRRLEEKRRFIQVIAGPRQVGKTTLIRQVIQVLPMLVHYASADEPGFDGSSWIKQQWEIARLKSKQGSVQQEVLLVLDEVQKIPHWSDMVKALWDEDTNTGLPLKVVLLGSAPLLIQRGLTESLAGRFEVISLTHWSYPEMREAFGWTVDQFVYFGGYPGAAELISDEVRWSHYILDSLVETSISRDILLMVRIDKPALLRQLFQIGCLYSGQILSYQKMLGQLQDAGNTTTLAHYLNLFSQVGMVTGLSKFVGKAVRQKASSPKLQVLNTALMSTALHHSFDTLRKNSEAWGRLVESAVGAHLINQTLSTPVEVFYWREHNHEVDFILRQGENITAIEVKSGLKREALPGIEAFNRAWPKARLLCVGAQGLSLEEFLTFPVKELVG